MSEQIEPSPGDDGRPGPPPPTATPPLSIVGVGASAGGLEALNRMFGAAPPDCPLAFVVVQHLSPDYPSMVADLLGKQTHLRVRRAADGTTLEPSTVYVVEPQTTLQVRRGDLVVEQQVRDAGLRLPIDILFRSLADEMGSHAACVVLSGTGSDGTRGARAIKEHGGVVIAQDPPSCGFDGMPASLIESGLADIVLPPEQIVDHLVRLQQPAGESLISEDKPVFEKILSVLSRHSDLDFTLYKPATIARRIEKRLRLMRFESSEEYYRLLRSDETEVEQLSEELLIGVTRFFRDAPGVASLQAALRGYLSRTPPSDEPLRVWICGCSTGEEAFTVAVALQEVLTSEGNNRGFRMFATDVNIAGVEKAARGRYSAAAVADIPAHLLRRYFVHEPSGGYTVTKEIRDRILFSRHNLLRDPPFSNLDLVCCRNVLIYFRSHVQSRVAQTFAFALKPGALLWLGSSESLGAEESYFEMLDSKWRLFRARGLRAKDPIPTRPFPLIKREPMRAVASFTVPPKRRIIDDAGELYRGLQRGFLPPYLVVDEEMQLVYRDGDLGDLIRVPEGLPTADVRAMLPEDLGLLLVTAWERLQDTGEDLCYKEARIGLPEGERVIDVRVRKVSQPSLKRRLMVAYFEGNAPALEPAVQVEVGRLAEDMRLRIRTLEEELGSSRVELQSTVEELESSNEELQSTNEELLASNEELQSVNEELQSVNEELHTVNSEYQAKLAELSAANADLRMLLTGLDVGVAFLDGDLTVRRFNPRASDFMHLLDQDVGRPFEHLNHGLGHDEVAAACRNALERGTINERLVSRDNREFVVRVSPVMIDGAPGGVLITVSDLSRLHKAQQVDHHLVQALEGTGLPIALLDREGRMTLATSSFSEYFRRDPRWLEGTSAISLLRPDDRARFQAAFLRASNGETWTGQFNIEVPGGERFVEQVRLAPVRDSQGGVRGILRVSQIAASAPNN